MLSDLRIAEPAFAVCALLVFLSHMASSSVKIAAKLAAYRARHPARCYVCVQLLCSPEASKALLAKRVIFFNVIV